MSGSTVPARSGFTLIEILMVVAIMGILAALLLPAVNLMRSRAKLTATELRLQAVLSGLQTAGAERDLDLILRQRVTGFTTPPPAAQFTAPIGQRLRTGAGWTIENAALKDFHARLGAELLHYAGVMAQAPDFSDPVADATILAGNLTSFASDRSPKRPWNDLWGNPLIVAYAIWQRAAGSSEAARAKTRGTYVAVASAGWIMPGGATLADRLATSWTNANVAADPAGTWQVSSSGTPNALADPPWVGIVRGRFKPTGSTSLLSTPQELP